MRTGKTLARLLQAGPALREGVLEAVGVAGEPPAQPLARSALLRVRPRERGGASRRQRRSLHRLPGTMH